MASPERDPFFEVSEPKYNTYSMVFWNQKPQILATWTLSEQGMVLEVSVAGAPFVLKLLVARIRKLLPTFWIVGPYQGWT